MWGKGVLVPLPPPIIYDQGPWSRSVGLPTHTDSDYTWFTECAFLIPGSEQNEINLVNTISAQGLSRSVRFCAFCRKGEAPPD